MSDYSGPERRNGTSLEKVHKAILDVRSEVRDVHDAQIETSVTVKSIQRDMRRGEGRFRDHDERIRSNAEKIAAGREAISNLKSEAKKSGTLAGTASGGITGALILLAEWIRSKLMGA